MDLNAPSRIMNVLPNSTSSAGVPNSWMVPASFRDCRSRFAATAAAVAAVPSRLCPQP